ncbi:hypothetical protein BQ8420_28065 [Nocardiopsis sp. JB363]|nr:hypothetical protein BQ8420_28065 [Nocardiopsis sp. JB363]
MTVVGLLLAGTPTSTATTTASGASGGPAASAWSAAALGAGTVFAFAGVPRAGSGPATPACSRVVGATTGTVTILGAASPALVLAATRALGTLWWPATGTLTVLRAASRTLTVFGTATPFSLGALGSAAFGATASALGARTSFGAGSGLGRARFTWGAFLVTAPPETSAVLGFGSATAAGTLFPGRALGPTPSAVTARTVARAIGPATAAIGTPSSFGTHVVLDCLSRPVGLTIPWWKRGSVPLGDR